jgi:F0F1-type ATP synthase delta subunit
MSKVSRRALAGYAADQLLAGKSAKSVAKSLAAQIHDSGSNIEPEFLLEDIAWELENRKALAVGHVTSASALSSKLEDDLMEHLKKVTKADKVVLEKHIDKSVIGGVRVETSGRVWDGTVLRALSELKEAF